jgi:hypothetical protein
MFSVLTHSLSADNKTGWVGNDSAEFILVIVNSHEAKRV